MAEAHEWTLRRLREMAGRLSEQAYLRASEAGCQDGEAQARWMLVFDRMARGLRLSIALEARLSRERRWDADEIEREASGQRCEPRWRRRGEASAEDAYPYESDREREDDGGLPQTAPLGERIGRLKAIIEGAGAPAPEPGLTRAEERALEPQRAERARRAASELPPDEPWDVLSTTDLAEHGLGDGAEPPWRGAG